MVQHVYERAAQSGATRVVVATDDERIIEAVRRFGGEACLTATSHVSGTDRLQEAAGQLHLADDDLVVNVQGDEPLVPAAVIDQVATNLASSGTAMATLCERIREWQDVLDPNKVKVVMARDGRALYFSRAPIPWDRSRSQAVDKVTYFRHLGIYAYRVSLLNEFVTWPPSPLEDAERLEQLRAMWQGVPIHVAEAVAEIPAGIDTAQDLSRVRAIVEASR